MGKKKDFIYANWVCLKCMKINPTYKPDRKRQEVLKKCLKCGAKKPVRAGL